MMKLAKSIATVLMPLAFGLCFACAPMAQAQATSAARPAVKAPVKPAPSMGAKPPAPKPDAPKPVSSKPVAARPIAAKPAKTAPAKAAVAVKPVAKEEPKTAPEVGLTTSPDEAPIAQTTDDASGARRDPFVPLVNDRKEGGGPALPPGKAGLVVATVRVDGTVRSGADLIAVVSNPERHVYFVREGDQLFDGSVVKIDLDGVTFHEESKDAFGKPVVREVTKRIYASAGEQQ